MFIEFYNQQLGILRIKPPEGRLMEYLEAIIQLGFEPEVKMS